jgi:CTP:molybdopterin cytidylyltransferase MocA
MVRWGIFIIGEFWVSKQLLPVTDDLLSDHSVKQALTLTGSCPDPIVILGTTSVISEVERIFRQS